MIGTWGSIVFEVSEKKVYTFSDFQRDEFSRWAKHDVLNQKPLPEFLGPDLGKITFSMKFSASLGVNPIKEFDRFVRMVRNGEAHTLVIGGKRYGVHKWYMPNTSQLMNYWDNKGHVLSGDLKVTMEEYV
ncbi:MAG: phage tail protein [Solibacillus sp.]